MSIPAVLVTGACGGIGRAVCALLTETGHRVVGADLPTARDAALACHARISLDVTDTEAVAEAVASLAAQGPLHAVVHAAGVLLSGPALEATPGDVARVSTVNHLGTVAVLTSAARAMIAQDPDGDGNRRCLVTIASNAARVPRAGMAAYAASKAAAAHFTRSLGLEIARHGIRCAVVSPGTTETPMLAGMPAGQDPVAGDPGIFRTGIPLRRIAQPRDVAGVVGFLLSPEAAHLTLTDIPVDGGATQT